MFFDLFGDVGIDALLAPGFYEKSYVIEDSSGNSASSIIAVTVTL